MLVDTGVGTHDVTAIRQIERLGFDPREVRHIVLTHLDDDFAEATVHMLQAERDDAFLRRTWLDRQRYRLQQWSTQQTGHPGARLACGPISA